ncbi:hypothetical protein THAOC_26130 [Thalassiosira oceanica]|uniref:Uncharacterized protein n=1 Tax=Thalassiosira oceanica TaxID=159749 RepID=K0RMD1_THAOC|nr:hypothetical protein THAOC_26130 [Thalassiosira oceanica]|eukprot:EJK54265.1 hypothetical protein THAOC_26130 [Thalassiosira oceanica]
MTVDYRHYPDQEAIVASWRQSLEADGFTRLDIGDEEELSSLLCLWPNWEDQDYYCHYRLTMHCKHNAVSATLPPAPQGHVDPGHWAYGRTLSMGVCAYGSDVHTALATVGGNSFTPVSSSDIDGRPDGHRIFFSDNPYWDLVGFENTPCNNGGIFLQAPAILGVGGVASVAVNNVDSTICVMSVDRHWIPSVVSWQESLESEEYAYGFTRLEPSQDLYIRINAGDSVGHTYNLTMHCKYFAASATLPPVPEGNLEGGGAKLQLGLCMYGNDVHSAAATIEGNAFTPVASSDIDGHELFFSDNPYWDLHGFEGTPCSDGGIFLRAPTLMGAGAVASVAVNPVDTAGQILHYPLQDCAGSSAEDSFCYDMTHHLNNDSGSSQPFLTDHYTRLGADFDSCSVLCERLADYVSNVDNPYRGVDVDMNSNRCYCLFDARPTCPQFPPASCFPWEGVDDGAGPVSLLRGEPGTLPLPSH